MGWLKRIVNGNAHQLAVGRLITAFAVLSVVPLALLAFFSVRLSSDAVRGEVEARVRSSATLSAVAVQKELEGVTGIVSSFARRPSLVAALQRRDAAELRRQLESLAESRPGIAVAFVAAPDGRLIDVVPPTPEIVGEDFSYRDWYRGAVSSGLPYVSEAFEGRAAGRPLVVAAADLVHAPRGKLIGVLSAAYGVNALQRLVDEFAATQDVRLTVTDQRGTVIAAPGRSLSGLVARGSDPRVAAALRNRSGIATHENADGAVLSAYTPVHGLGWTVIAEAPMSRALAPVDRLRSAVLAITAVLGLALLAGIVGVALALRGRRQAEEEAERSRVEAERARAEAERANRAKSEFLSRMSHELRTPMNAVLGFGQLLAMDGLTPSQKESVEQILKAGDHLLGLINEVLDISRIEAGRLSVSLEPVSVDDAVCEALELIRPIADEHGVVLASFARTGLHALADRQRLKQVLLNLLSNAVKYNRRGGSVRVEARATGDGVRLSVSDTGAGIPADKLERLFSPFDRLDADQSAVEGTGLGLALSKGLVEAMDGRLGVESRPGVGSTFSLELCHAEDEAARMRRADAVAAVVSAPNEHDGADTRTVLYVEDNLSNLKLVERVLEHRPEIRLLAAMQGGLGLELAREHRPDLILLDLHLPDIQGDELLARLRADAATSGIPVVVLSADATPGRIERLRAQGADDYLAKPLDVKRFFEVLDELLGRAPVAA